MPSARFCLSKVENQSPSDSWCAYPDVSGPEPIFGFLLRNRHGIHLYGTNTDLQQLRLGKTRRGEIVENLPALNAG